MFKDHYKNDSGEAETGAVILTTLFIAAGLVLLVVNYGLKVTPMLNALGHRF